MLDMMAVMGDNTDIIVVDHCFSSNKCAYPLVTLRVYPYPCSRVSVYVGSDIPYPDPYPPNPYLHTPVVSETLAQH